MPGRKNPNPELMSDNVSDPLLELVKEKGLDRRSCECDDVQAEISRSAKRQPIQILQGLRHPGSGFAFAIGGGLPGHGSGPAAGQGIHARIAENHPRQHRAHAGIACPVEVNGGSVQVAFSDPLNPGRSAPDELGFVVQGCTGGGRLTRGDCEGRDRKILRRGQRRRLGRFAGTGLGQRHRARRE